MNRRRVRRVGLAGALLAATVLAGGFAEAQSSGITMCHQTGNGGWVEISPNANAAIAGHDGHERDIIPAFTVRQGNRVLTYPGKNLDTDFGGATGQEILDNGCTLPTTPTTTSTTSTTTTTSTTSTTTTTSTSAPPTTPAPAPTAPSTSSTTTTTSSSTTSTTTPSTTTTTTTTTTAPPTTSTTAPSTTTSTTTTAPPASATTTTTAPPTTDPESPLPAPPDGGASPPSQTDDPDSDDPPVGTDPPGGPDLPHTGSAVTAGLGAGLVMLFLGAVLQVMSRSRLHVMPQRRRTS